MQGWIPFVLSWSFLIPTAAHASGGFSTAPSAAVFRDFILRYLAVLKRGQSPLYLFGESYGTPRTAARPLLPYPALPGIAAPPVRVRGPLADPYVPPARRRPSSTPPAAGAALRDLVERKLAQPPE
jgi:hypothetical protein